MTKPNELVHETSPYLLQHAYNPVQWYPWGEKALQMAIDLDRPILVSIGYAACHWCHVMEKESFEDEDTASYMNDHFVNIKIDREERPDLDHIYMDAVQAITGSGGWPLNVFLTPDTKPFYGGTYFPPKKAFNRPSWMDVLQNMNEYWHQRRDEVISQANQLLAHLEKSNQLFTGSTITSPGENFFTWQNAKLIADNLLKNADKEEGGFGNPPKFLQTGSIQYLLQYAQLSGEPSYAEHALFTLKKMIRGGIYDQVAGGISRYSTDKEWLVPHFEKMLYDNALLVSTLCEAYAFKADPELEEAIQGTVNFVQSELKHPQGGYFTALDADSEGEEGKYYVWTKAEIEELLGDEAALFCDYYDVSAEGNWEHRNILNVPVSLQSFCESRQLDIEDTASKLKQSRQQLLLRRQERVPPGLDDKILLNNNALFISALTKAYACTGQKSWKTAAEEASFFIEDFLKNENGQLFHNFKNGRKGVPAFLDDYAYYIDSLIHLQEVTGNQGYLRKARIYLEDVIRDFSDENGLFFYYSSEDQKDIIVRKTEFYDGAMPSSNAIMARVLGKMGILFEMPLWSERSVKILANISPATLKYPGSFSYWASQYLAEVSSRPEIAILGKNTSETLEKILAIYIPHSVIQSNTGADLAEFPLLKNKPVEEQALIYLCENYSCQLPVKTPEELARNLKNRWSLNWGSQ